LADTEIAFEGIPHAPANGKIRAPLAGSAGPPAAPFGFRVSIVRHGLTVKNLVGAVETGSAVTVIGLVVWFEPAEFAAVSFTVYAPAVA
jgi:hypothetical protein